MDAEERDQMRRIQTDEACSMVQLNMTNGQLMPLHKLAVEGLKPRRYTTLPRG
ncbi:hypothetical protein [Paenibacillus elgii]|uniref:hypothetical protein n=1 Tax=Paenibacillus elgii TaxID=189691 RepID=UPI00167A38EE|nr:hypothetical protein [Paenibacillus elgii]